MYTVVVIAQPKTAWNTCHMIVRLNKVELLAIDGHPLDTQCFSMMIFPRVLIYLLYNAFCTPVSLVKSAIHLVWYTPVSSESLDHFICYIIHVVDYQLSIFW